MRDANSIHYVIPAQAGIQNSILGPACARQIMYGSITCHDYVAGWSK